MLKNKTQTEGREKENITHSHKKTDCKLLVKMTPAIDFINILRARFFQNISRKSFQKQHSYKKFVRKKVDEIDTWIYRIRFIFFRHKIFAPPKVP